MYVSIFLTLNEHLSSILTITAVENTGNGEVLWNVNDLPDNHTFFWYQETVNHDVKTVPSHMVIAEHQMKKGEDYRYEDKPNPVEALL